MRIAPFVLLLCVLVAACTSLKRQEPPSRVLFVGNSLTYVGNVPVLYQALAVANGHPVNSDMIVRGGATLTQRVADGSVERALASRRYRALVLQERGGDLMCSFGPDACEQSQKALKTLAALAARHGVTVVLLGSYQPHAAASRRLVQAESAAARAVGMPYIQVSETLRLLRQQAPGLTWFATDGMHPGKDLALLNAMLVFRTLHGSLPARAELTVEAPIYDVSSGLTESLRAADAPPPQPETPREVRYTGETVGLLWAALHVRE